MSNEELLKKVEQLEREMAALRRVLNALRSEHLGISRKIEAELRLLDAPPLVTKTVTESYTFAQKT